MRVPSALSSRRATVELQLTPMIDCVFLLMIYFLWSANFGTAEYSLPSKLSAVSAQASTNNANRPLPPEQDPLKTIIRILNNGGAPIWTLNGTPIGSLADLRQQLAAIARIKPDAPIVLDPASDVPLGDVIDVFDVSRLLGFQRIQFATSSDGLR